MTKKNSLIQFPDDFPHKNYTEIFSTIHKISCDIEFIFDNEGRVDNFKFNNWANKAKREIVLLISKFADNKHLKEHLISFIKLMKEDFLSRIGESDSLTYESEKIDIYPFVDFIDERLNNIKFEKELVFQNNYKPLSISEWVKEGTEYIDMQNKKEKKHLNKLKNKAKKIKTVSDKINYWEKAKKDYLEEVKNNLGITVASGFVTTNFGKGEWFLDREISKIIDELKLSIPQQAETKTGKLKVPQIALLYIYEGKIINEDNAKEIAANYGYIAKTSGKGLYHDYLKYCKTSDRKAVPTAETKKTLENKIELFESVLIHLSDKGKKMAIDEINILKTILEKEYQ